MRKLLNNPWIVTALAVAALAAVTRSYWPVGWSGNAAAAQVVAGESDSRPAEISPAETTSVQSGDDLTALTGAAARRDPFAPAQKSAALITALEKPKPDFVDTVRLTALWSQDGVTYAIINGAIVHPGDQIGRLKIESATADGVWLVHWKGRDLLTLGGEFTLRTPAAGSSVLSPSNGAVLTSSL